MKKNLRNISLLIAEHLAAYASVAVSGLGTLYVTHRNAQYADARDAMTPPSQQIIFDESFDQAEDFVYYVAAHLGIKPKKAKEKIEKYAQHIINDLLNYGKSDLAQLGTLVRGESGTVDFTNGDGYATEHFGLPEVPLKPILFIKGDDYEATPPAHISTYVASTTETTSTTAAVGSTASLAADTPADNMTEESSTIAPYVPPSFDEEESSGSFWRWILSILALILLAVLIYKGCEYYKENSQIVTIIDDDTEHADTIDQVISELEEVSPDDTLTATTVEEPEKEIDNGVNITECIIILGAYESSRNAMKMVDRVSQLGYQPYQEYFDTMGVTRVGLAFDCSNEDIVAFIKNIRQNVSRDAWYLVPRITVE